MRHHPSVLLLTIAMIAGPARFARADPPAEPVVRTTVRPVATTEPALQYKLLPELTDQTPGNAATLYLMASKLGPSDPKLASELMDRVVDYLDAPLEQLDRDKAAQALPMFTGRLHMADLAAHRQDAQWDYSLREDGIDALLPHLNDVRGLANLWSLQSRLRIIDNDWPGAARTITDGLSLARQLNRQAVEIQGLLGAGIADEMLERGARDWIAHGDSPNLYWPLSSLPEPFVDIHEIALWERSAACFTLPILRDAQNGSSDPDRWRALFARLPGLVGSQYPRSRPTPESQFQAAILAAIAYPRARADLLSRGRSAQEIEAMPVDQVVGIFFADQYHRLSDNAWKAWELPFWEGARDLRDAVAAVQAEQHGPGGNPLLAFVPQIERARYQFARLDREIALLRVVEAVRDYAARHDGGPPDSLDQIKDLPIPIDPVRGQPFHYERNGQTVTIEAIPYDGQPVHGERYELMIKQ